MDGYDAKITDGIDKFSVPMKGSKTFTYPFTVSKQARIHNSRNFIFLFRSCIGSLQNIALPNHWLSLLQKVRVCLIILIQKIK